MPKTRVYMKKRGIPPSKVFGTIRASVIPKMQKAAKHGVDLRGRFTFSWSSQSTPKWRIDTNVTRKKVEVKIHRSAPNAEGAHISVWQLLDDGTDIRYMVMTPGFKPKTARGRIQSVLGQGTASHLNGGREGIEKREQTETINEATEPVMAAAIEIGLAEGFART